MKLLAVTACPTGIAHTYIAAEKLKQAAAEKKIWIKVETRGSIGIENPLTDEEIEEADGIIIAADKDVQPGRFQGKPVLIVSVQDAIHQTDELFQRFVDGNVPIYEHNKPPQQKVTDDFECEKKKAPAKDRESKVKKYIYRDLMNGVSYMIPFVVIGGLLIALSLGIGGVPTTDGFVIPDSSVWKKINEVGTTGFMFMIPILSGYIAMSIADRPGLAPGMIGGYIAANGHLYNSEAGAGFIGGILAGFLAGYIAK